MTVEDIGVLRSSGRSPTLEEDTRNIPGIALRSEIILEQASLLNLYDDQINALQKRAQRCIIAKLARPKG